MKPFPAPLRLIGCNNNKEKNLNEEVEMKIRTKLAIFLVAAVLSLAGFGVLAEALSVDKIVAAATPTTEVGVHIVG
jgi:hypothetical protein